MPTHSPAHILREATKAAALKREVRADPKEVMIELGRSGFAPPDPR
jgi:hypothetical protein